MEEKVLRNQNYAEELIRLMGRGVPDSELVKELENYHENDIAEAFRHLTKEERQRLYRILGAEKLSDIFSYMENVDCYLGEMDISEAAKIIGGMDSDDAVDALMEMDDVTGERLVRLMDDESSRNIRLIQSYGEDEIGSEMTTNFIRITDGMTVKQAMRALIAQAEKNDNISTIYVDDRQGKFYGAIDLKSLITAREHTELDTIISTSYPYVYAHEKISDCIERMKDYAEDSIPVLSDDERLIGVITAQDLVEVVDDEMGEDYAKLAGLTAEEDLNETTGQSIKKRMPWLIVLLFLGMAVSSVVGIFDVVVAQIAGIVCFQSLILDMAGNVGTQSLAVTIRVLMDETLRAKQKALLVVKEMRVGFCNGLLLSALSFVCIMGYLCLFKQEAPVYAASVSLCVSLALVISMVISSLVGTAVPMFFHKIKIDPAVASGPLITTVNDLVAVVTYYGLAWLLLMDVMNL